MLDKQKIGFFSTAVEGLVPQSTLHGEAASIGSSLSGPFADELLDATPRSACFVNSYLRGLRT